jgi:hypothetical protein
MPDADPSRTVRIRKPDASSHREEASGHATTLCPAHATVMTEMS